MGDLQVVGGIKKLNNQNYNTWATCMESYLQAQDIWDIVSGTKVAPPPQYANNSKKWKMRAGKALFTIKTTIEKEMLYNTKGVQKR